MHWLLFCIDGARAIVGGSAIIGQNDVRGVIREFRDVTLKARRQALLKKANELGGAELVNKWIDLHQVGDKKDQLNQNGKGGRIHLTTVEHK